METPVKARPRETCKNLDAFDDARAIKNKRYYFQPHKHILLCKFWFVHQLAGYSRVHVYYLVPTSANGPAVCLVVVCVCVCVCPSTSGCEFKRQACRPLRNQICISTNPSMSKAELLSLFWQWFYYLLTSELEICSLLARIDSVPIVMFVTELQLEDWKLQITGPHSQF